jgi:3-isopropylmalate/(R)-2-methylmalate dehydratase large subunit
MEVEERLTLANMAVELGARFGIMAPDEKVVRFLAGRPYAPVGVEWERATAAWKLLVSDPEARFDQEILYDVSSIAPQITWGTGLDQTVAIDETIPNPEDMPDTDRRRLAEAALDYMGLEPGRPIAGTPVDWVFIGSCANGRLSDLRRAAAVLDGRKVAPGIRAWVVPGSTAVKIAAEAEGLAARFIEAGFEWRESGCSLCCAANGERISPGQRTVSTSNRNFMGRQGPGVRTHVTGPETAVASALAGVIAAA